MNCLDLDFVDNGAQNIDLNTNQIVKTQGGKLCLGGGQNSTRTAGNNSLIYRDEGSARLGLRGLDALGAGNEELNFTRFSLYQYLGSKNIKQAFLSPESALHNSSQENFEGARACGNAKIAQTETPGTVISETYANPRVRYPAVGIDSGEHVFDSNFDIESFTPSGGTVVIYKRGEGKFTVDSNNGIAQDTSDMACYRVPTCPQETLKRGGRCFCMGLDFTNGVPPTQDWRFVKPCLTKIKCPDQLDNGEFVDSLSIMDSEHTPGRAAAEGSMIFWQYNNTKAFQVNHAKQVRDNLSYHHGFCNPMMSKFELFDSDSHSESSSDSGSFSESDSLRESESASNSLSESVSQSDSENSSDSASNSGAIITLPVFNYDASGTTFDGSNKLSLGTPLSEISGTNPRTVEVYVSTTNTVTEGCVVFYGNRTITNGAFQFMFNTKGKIKFIGHETFNSRSVFSIIDGQEYRVAISYDGYYITFLRQTVATGDEVVERYSMIGLNTTQENLTIGGRDDFNKKFVGTIGVVNIYDVAVTSFSDLIDYPPVDSYSQSFY